ncbi:hypothetical protein [Holdemania sp. Marseille-P2844]|uniref:hypothetical protein n=1 Tax=Holdemania sp. Marseille-P2844 TaxID=1852366 RepID=UPI000932873D|nr:hypothetical protein [Holdemania sp. Marseille-P2844]
MIDEKKLTKEECLKATKELKDSFLLHTPRYISFHSPRIMKHISNLEKLINKHFDNPPLKFKELEDGEWYWCEVYGWCLMNFYEDLNGKINYEAMTVTHDKIDLLEEFEENRFYRNQVEE